MPMHMHLPAQGTAGLSIPLLYCCGLANVFGLRASGINRQIACRMAPLIVIVSSLVFGFPLVWMQKT